MRFPTGLVLVATVCAAVVAAQDQTQQPVPFRSGVDLIRLDVSVLGPDRRPVRGLTAADFTVLENDKPQSVVGFTAVDVPARISPTAPWLLDVAPDVVSNEMGARRLIVIVLDDAHLNSDPGTTTTARRVAKGVIRQLGPLDLAAVVFTDSGTPQNFTTDPKLLEAAVDSLAPHPASTQCLFKAGGCDVETLTHVSDVLREAPGRKAVFFISSARRLTSAANYDRGRSLTDIVYIHDMFRKMQQANVMIYGFDPAGLRTGPVATEMSRDLSTGIPSADTRRPVEDCRCEEIFLPGTEPPDRYGAQVNATLRSFAESTGGRAITAMNKPWTEVQSAFQENGSYYLVAFRSSDQSRDGRFRKIDVKVNRPNVETRTRSGYFAPSAEQAQAAAPKSLIVQTLERGLPSGDLPLRVTAAPFASAGTSPAEVAVVVGVRDDASASAGAPRRVEILASAFDANWQPRGTAHQTIELTPQAGEGPNRFEVVSRLPLAPGRYELRVAADSAGRAGGLFFDVVVPDFAKEPLALSGLVLEHNQAPPSAPPSALADLLPIVPTAGRDFAAADHVTAFLRIYQGGKSSISPVQVSARIVDEKNRKVVDESAVLGGDRFGDRRAADHRWEVPLSRLEPGEHLLTLDVSAGKNHVERHIRFTVRPAAKSNEALPASAAAR